MDKYCIITTACNSMDIANKIIDSLLEKRLVSCCQMMNIQSAYWWEGEIVKEPEFLIQMKTKKSLFEEVRDEILRLHDYDICEISSVDIEQGSDSFLNWLSYETK